MRVFAIFVFLLILLRTRFWFFYKDLPQYKQGQTVSFMARLSEEQELTIGGQRFRVEDKNGNKISIVTQVVPRYHYGDRLFMEGVFTITHQRYFMYYPNVQIARSDANFLSQLDVYIKTASINLFNGAIPPTSSALLLGIVFGGRQGMPQVFMEKLRVVGAIHVIAASGMNVIFVAVALVTLFGKMMKRQYVLVMSVIGVVFYFF